MHLFCFTFCTWNRYLSRNIVFSHLLPLCCRLIQSGTSASLSCWHPVWFYHMCLRWIAWFFFLLCAVCIQIKLLFSCLHLDCKKTRNDASDDVTESFSYPVVTELIEDRFWGSKDWFKLKSILVNRLFHIKIIILIYVKIKRCVLTMVIQLQLDNIPEGYISKLHASTWPTVVTMCRE